VLVLIGGVEFVCVVVVVVDVDGFGGMYRVIVFGCSVLIIVIVSVMRMSSVVEMSSWLCRLCMVECLLLEVWCVVDSFVVRMVWLFLMYWWGGVVMWVVVRVLIVVCLVVLVGRLCMCDSVIMSWVLRLVLGIMSGMSVLV